jgi:hypothetical protein
MPEKYKGKKTEKAGAAVEEEHLLSFVNMCDCICMQVDIEEAHASAPIVSIDYGLGNVCYSSHNFGHSRGVWNNDEDILDLETPTECEDKEEVSEWKAGCSSKASLPHKGHENHNNDMEPLMNVYKDDDVEVEYEFHNNVAFVQIELGLEEEDVEEVQGLSQIRPTLQTLNSLNMWIGDTGATKHSMKHKQGGINSRLSTSRTRGIYGQAAKPSMEIDLPEMYCDKSSKDQFAVKL